MEITPQNFWFVDDFRWLWFFQVKWFFVFLFQMRWCFEKNCTSYSAIPAIPFNLTRMFQQYWNQPTGRFWDWNANEVTAIVTVAEVSVLCFAKWVGHLKAAKPERKFLDWMVTGNISAPFCFQSFGECCFSSDEPISYCSGALPPAHRPSKMWPFINFIFILIIFLVVIPMQEGDGFSWLGGFVYAIPYASRLAAGV